MGVTQEKLFDDSDYYDEGAIARSREALGRQYPILRILGIEVPQFHSLPRECLQVELMPDRTFLMGGQKYFSRFGFKFHNDSYNYFGWVEDAHTKSRFLTGFLQCVSFVEGEHPEPILHLYADETDLVSSSFAARLSDIKAIYRYGIDPSLALMAYQNALVDGDTKVFNIAKGHAEWPILDQDDLEPFVTNRWPDPELIYES